MNLWIELLPEKNTPAYDLVGYFNQLDSADGLSFDERDRLSVLLREHDDVFVQRVLSIRTQFYMNTHRSAERVEQAMCSLLRLKYARRMLRG